MLIGTCRSRITNLITRLLNELLTSSMDGKYFILKIDIKQLEYTSLMEVWNINDKQIKVHQTMKLVSRITIQNIYKQIVYFICLFHFRFMDPLTTGDYPKSMRFLVRTRLPKFTKEQSKLLIDSFDFIGINYYSTSYASDAPQLKSNAKISYLTDSLANFSCKRTCLISIYQLY